MSSITPKPTTYCDITFRSRLEARWAIALDHIPNVLNWTYEPYTFQIPNKLWAYTPDFNVKCFCYNPFQRRPLETTLVTFNIEVKPDDISDNYRAYISTIMAEATLPIGLTRMPPLVIICGDLYGRSINFTTYAFPPTKAFMPNQVFENFGPALSEAINYRFDLKAH